MPTTINRHAIDVMGTVFSLEWLDDIEPDVVAAVEADLRWVDATFSTFRPDSAISRLAGGSVRLSNCPDEVSQVLDLCLAAQRRTGGWFSATAGGRLDPTGLVKGWAIARVDRILRAAGSTRHAVNGGGDICAGAPPDPHRLWQLGISDPLRPSELLAVVSGSDFAVATSGITERGAHVRNPFSGLPATGLAAVTVVGPDIVDADVYATAALAMGPPALQWLEDLSDYEAMLVTPSGASTTTSGWAWTVAGS